MKQPAITITVNDHGLIEEFIVFGLKAGRDELALRKRLNPGCVVTMTGAA